jgi:hypothetical protein
MQDPTLDAPPPILSSWRRVYAAILLLEAVVIALIALFQAGRY